MSRMLGAMGLAFGSRTMPIDVWINSHNLVRRLSRNFGECVANQRLSVGTTMDLYDYGPQVPTPIPSASQSYDITPVLSAALNKARFGCSSG
jgi:hypothetical protein